MEFTIGQNVNHKTLGAGTVTDVYEQENGNMYFDVHFEKDDAKYMGKYMVSTFKLETADQYFD